MTREYEEFLARKAIVDQATGLHSADLHLPEVMFPFQRDITAWACRRGRAAIFAGTGLGKSLMELAWADAIHRETGKDILHLAPLAVSSQMVREADKFHIVARQVRSQSDCLAGTNITNFQKLDHFDLSRFGGVILDESSILKNVDGHYRKRLIEECAQIPFRLAATATPAPNDFMELGNHAEFLGVMSYTDMLATFFVHDGGDTQKWRLKGHAEHDFWKWMASWAVVIRKPSDLGYSNKGYDLPPLIQHQHTVSVDGEIKDGELFASHAQGLSERIRARRDSVAERCELAASIVLADWNDKLAKCLGNLNTLKIDAGNITPVKTSESVENHNLDLGKTTKDTCENTLKRTPKNTSSRKQQETQTFDQNMGSEQPSTMKSSINKVGNAPSATLKPSIHGAIDLPLIIATRRERFEAFCAIAATTGLVTSEMIPNDCAEPWLIWCNLNSEQDALEKAFSGRCFSVRGNSSEDEKERSIVAWVNGEKPVMISKPSIMGFGLNFQHCCNTVFVGLNDSYEQVFQSIRRFWRFGQTQEVNAHFIAASTEGAVVANLKRKEADAERMGAAMVMHMADFSTRNIRGQVRDTPNYDPQQKLILPNWIAA